jgi:hypothetical protein
MSSLPEADVKLVEWNSDVYEPSDVSNLCSGMQSCYWSDNFRVA